MWLAGLRDCCRCPRLVAYRQSIPARAPHRPQDYHNAPVAGFGDEQARIWLIGLAPGAQGANRTGRPFTGDGAGDFMYPLLHEAGLCSQPLATAANDGLRLHDLYISNAVRCVPPANRPTTAEFQACQRYLQQEWQRLPCLRVVLALGRESFLNLLRLQQRSHVLRLADYPFSHACCYRLPTGHWLLGSYHTSRYNLNTGRIDAAAFRQVLDLARELATRPSGESG